MKVLDYLESRETGTSLTESDIFAIHKKTTQNILPESLQNTYRTEQNVIYNGD